MRSGALLLLAGLAACDGGERAAPPAGPVIPPAETRPPHIAPSIKWFPESQRYQSVRREVFKSGTDFKSKLDLGDEQASRAGLYRVKVLERPEAVTGQFQEWLLRIETADGKPVSGAYVAVKGGMPEHGHGLSSQPEISAGAAPGEYRVRGVQFNMPGWWELSLYISHQRRDDTVVFNVIAS